MSEHKIRKGRCIECGCDTQTIEYFGWSCSGRTIQHHYQQGTCVNCGFCQEVIEHFDWPCRLDYRLAHAGEPFQERRGQDRRHTERSSEDLFRGWHYQNDETRYGRLLGLRGKVTKGDIKCAYREQANLYHPDRVAHLAPDIQKLATERMKEINLAFSFFRHKYDL